MIVDSSFLVTLAANPTAAGVHYVDMATARIACLIFGYGGREEKE